jgi:hypothetical protein
MPNWALFLLFYGLVILTLFSLLDVAKKEEDSQNRPKLETARVSNSPTGGGLKK